MLEREVAFLFIVLDLYSNFPLSSDKQVVQICDYNYVIGTLELMLCVYSLLNALCDVFPKLPGRWKFCKLFVLEDPVELLLQ